MLWTKVALAVEGLKHFTQLLHPSTSIITQTHKNSLRSSSVSPEYGVHIKVSRMMKGAQENKKMKEGSFMNNKERFVSSLSPADHQGNVLAS